MKFEIKRIVTSQFYLFILVICFPFITSDFAEGAGDQLANKRYVDPKGYFKIVPPAGWRSQEYPQDTRGKVVFISPESNIDLRVLVNAVDFSTTEDLVGFCKDIEKRIGINTNIERITFGGSPVVKRVFQFKGQKFYAIDFLVGKVDHNLQYGGSPDKYDKYLSVAMKSMETYEPIMRDVSDKEMTKHLVAKNLRLAQLMIENGNFDLAMEFVKEGLEASPNDSELLKMKKQIEEKRKK